VSAPQFTATAVPTVGAAVTVLRLIDTTLASGVFTLPANAGMVETIPKPNAATATSAIRLIDVFVDIYFLSVVDLVTFTRSAWV
jgi:hypothetical protein